VRPQYALVVTVGVGHWFSSSRVADRYWKTALAVVHRATVRCPTKRLTMDDHKY